MCFLKNGLLKISRLVGAKALKITPLIIRNAWRRIVREDIRIPPGIVCAVAIIKDASTTNGERKCLTDSFTTSEIFSSQKNGGLFLLWKTEQCSLNGIY